MGPRIASSVLAGALLRKAEGEGGFGAVLAKGDSTAGAMLVILLEKGRKAAILERILQPDGTYKWQNSGPQASGNEDDGEKFLSRRRQIDPDLWIIELDIASAERFTAEMNTFD